MAAYARHVAWRSTSSESGCTTPTSSRHSPYAMSAPRLNSKNHRPSGERITTATFGSTSRNARSTSHTRAAWPNPCPDTYATMRMGYEQEEETTDSTDNTDRSIAWRELATERSVLS